MYISTETIPHLFSHIISFAIRYYAIGFMFQFEFTNYYSYVTFIQQYNIDTHNKY